MNKLYQKSQLWFSIVFIIIYVVGASVCDALSDIVGIRQVFTLAFLLALSLILIIWMKKNKLLERFGLCKPKFNSNKFLFYIPLLILVSTNFWFGVRLNYSVIDSVICVLTMLAVGVVEELVFRGLLFRALEKDNLIRAIIISSVTFGMGHIVNLISGGYENLLPCICQVFYAMAVGLLFVIMFYKGGSIIACIITHSLVNAFSVFQNVNAITPLIQIFISLAIILVSVIYTLILCKTLTPTKKET